MIVQTDKLFVNMLWLCTRASANFLQSTSRTVLLRKILINYIYSGLLFLYLEKRQIINNVLMNNIILNLCFLIDTFLITSEFNL